MFRFNNPILPGIVTLFLLTGCQRAPEKRTYLEVVESASLPAHHALPMSGELDTSAIPDDDIHAFLREGQGIVPGPMAMTGVVDPQTQKMLAPPMAGLEASVARPASPAGGPPLSWATPEGWQEIPGSGMRMVTFRSADTKDPVECALISLAGAAGGLESNAARWMQQVNIVVPEAPDMEEFLAAQKKIKIQGGFDATIIDLTQLQSKDDLESPSMAAAIITLPDMTVFVKMTGSRGAVLKNKNRFEALCESLKLN